MATPQPDSRHNFTFPPFPNAPEGTQVIPFKDFKEGGIRVNPGPDETEVDSFGIPTVPMTTRHDTDFCKTKTKRKRKAEEEEKARKEFGRKVKKEWWEVWEETEVIRYTSGVDRRTSRFERIQAATYDFADPKNRTWPAQNIAETGPKYIWEKFLRYIGLPEGYQPFTEQIQSKKKKREAKEAEDDSMSDDSDDEDDEGGTKISKEGNIILSSAGATDSKNEERLLEFLDDPEKTIKVFMSSYSWTKGYVWSEPNLDIIPRLLRFFVNFLLRNKVLPECERQLRQSLKAIEAGLVELPNCATIMKILPDKFGTGCSECWGRKAELYSYADSKFPDSAITSESPPRTEGEDAAEPRAKKQRVDVGDSSDNQDNDVQDGGWGSGEGWGDGSNVERPNEWTNEDLQRLAWESNEKLQPLFEFLGPTAFPLTHQPAVVEQSMRRIKSISPPASNPPKATPGPEIGPNAAAVEIDLDSNFSKIVLAPMPDWDNGVAPVYASPLILKSSRGPVIQPGSATEHAEDSKDGLSRLNSRPHDPLRDDITLLIESKQADLLREGMGIAGTFVQLVRQRSDIPSKKKKSKSKKPPVYWYIEEAAFIAVSFWSSKG